MGLKDNGDDDDDGNDDGNYDVDIRLLSTSTTEASYNSRTVFFSHSG